MIEMFCGKGYHPEKSIAVEITTNPISRKKLVEFKCLQCGKVFHRAILDSDLNIKKLEAVVEDD